jgi:hypothetical protein
MNISFNSFNSNEEIEDFFSTLPDNTLQYLQLKDNNIKLCIYNLEFPTYNQDMDANKYGMSIAEYIRICVNTSFNTFLEFDNEHLDLSFKFYQLSICSQYFTHLIDTLSEETCNNASADKEKIIDYYHFLVIKNLEAVIQSYKNINQFIDIQKHVDNMLIVINKHKKNVIDVRAQSSSLKENITSIWSNLQLPGDVLDSYIANETKKIVEYPEIKILTQEYENKIMNGLFKDESERQTFLKNIKDKMTNYRQSTL